MIDKSKFEKVWESTELEKTFGLIRIPAKISKNNVRQTFSIEEIKTSNLAKSIKEMGLQQLPVANGDAEIFIGGRRSKALEYNGEVLIPVEIRDISDEDQRLASYSENKTKLDMTADEEGRILTETRDFLKISATQLAKRLGEAETYVHDRIAIYEKIVPICPATGRIPYRGGTKDLTFEKAKSLYSDWIPLQIKKDLINKIISEGMSEEELKTLLKNSKEIKTIIENVSDPKVKQEIEQIVSPKLFTKDLDKEQTTWWINERTGGVHPLKEKLYPEEIFVDFDTANAYAHSMSGTCLGKKIYWVLKIDPLKEERALQQVKKEDETDVSKES